MSGPATWSAGKQRYKIMVNEQGHTELAVSVVDLDDQQERLLNLTLNKVSGRWDEEALAVLLEQQQETGADIGLSEFDQEEIGELIASLPSITEMDPPVIEDDLDIEKALGDIKEPETQRGDVWQLGPHLLMCGDATDPEDVAMLMGDAKATLVVTDPPYNVAVECDSARLAEAGTNS
ncbi:hypothetical protein [Paenibacillus vini]|uniref:hypothetical protein n=1 Tax=Paenibacillus vini TaxID=1476024 RepID=UPI00338F291F